MLQILKYRYVNPMTSFPPVKVCEICPGQVVLAPTKFGGHTTSGSPNIIIPWWSKFNLHAPECIRIWSAVFFVEKSVEFSNILRHWFLNVIKKNFWKIQLPLFKLTFNDISKNFFTNEFQNVFASISFREWPISKNLSIQTLKKIYPLSKEKETF